MLPDFKKILTNIAGELIDTHNKKRIPLPKNI